MRGHHDTDNLDSNQDDNPDHIESTLKHLKAEYTSAMQALKKLEKEKLIKSNQLENSQTLLNEIQTNLLEKNQEIKKLLSSQEESQNSRDKKVKDYIKDRDLKELDKKLEEKLLELAKKRAPLLSVKPLSIKDFKKETDEKVMKIHTVKILYLKGVKDGDIAKKDRSYALEMSLRLLTTTTFKDMKRLACEYWDLEEGVFSLRAFNFALIEYIDDPVETFIKDQKMRPEFWLIEKNVNAVKCLTGPGEYYTEDASKGQSKGKDNNKNHYDLEGRKTNYKKFVNFFDGGALYIMPQVSSIDENHEVNRLESWELNIFTVTVTVILFLLTVLFHYLMGDFSNRYWISQQMVQTFENAMKQSGFTYDSIKNIDDVSTFMQGPISSIYFGSFDANTVASNPYTNQYVPIGTMKVRFLETKSVNCPNQIIGIVNQQCYYDVYNSDTRNQYGNGDNKVFYTASQNGISSVIAGEFSNYDGSGFSWDFTYDELGEYQQKVANNTDLYSNMLRAILISFSHYSPNYDYWIFTQVVIEISVYGSIFIHEVQPQVFKPNLSVKTYQYLLAISMLRSLISLYFLFYYFYYSLTKDKTNKRNLEYFYSIRGLLDLSFVVLSFVSLGYAFSLNGDEQGYLNSKKYIDFTLLSTNFFYAILINAWSVIPISLRFFNCLTINRNVYIMKLNIEQAVRGILTYIILIISLFVGFMFVSWNVWGPYYYYYRNLSYAMINNILFTIGFGNTPLLLKINLFWTILFYILYLNFSIFILISGFIGIYMESNRQVRLQHGYRDDVKVWAFVDYIVWFLGCMNQKRLRQRIDDMIKLRKQREEERNKKEIEKKNEAERKEKESKQKEEKSDSGSDKDS